MDVILFIKKTYSCMKLIQHTGIRNWLLLVRLAKRQCKKTWPELTMDTIIPMLLKPSMLNKLLA